MQQDHDPKKRLTITQIINIIHNLARALSDPFLIWVRVPASEGSRTFGIHAGAGTLFYFLFIADWSRLQATIFFYASIATYLLRAVAGALYRMPDTASNHVGRSIPVEIVEWITGRWMNGAGVRGGLDVAMLVLVGWALTSVSPGLSVSLYLAAAGWAFRVWIYCLEQGAVGRAMTDARADYQQATGKRSVANGGRARAGSSPGKKLAKGVMVTCVTAVGWLAYSQMDHQLESLPAFASSLSSLTSLLGDSGLKTEWEDHQALHPDKPMSFEEFKRERRLEELLKRQQQEANRRGLELQREQDARDAARRQAWRRWNQGYGY
ncbi:MAG: hypothetical protein P4L85_14080 [Paludisphaera borealis]|uniref:hypothetical protein n=1 Tax=Paludisphaera borealis TaxID=1387353 RepID=UPI002850750F|nr:hypothetical protein [Paludisphaera borealis]MDR3620475.1 hypothetical protein [Paludisphaera borealis]